MASYRNDVCRRWDKPIIQGLKIVQQYSHRCPARESFSECYVRCWKSIFHFEWSLRSLTCSMEMISDIKKRQVPFNARTVDGNAAEEKMTGSFIPSL
ncbi:hypothetical protein AB1N83_006172 [Pleurotus pulmonarius]